MKKSLLRKIELLRKRHNDRKKYVSAMSSRVDAGDDKGHWITTKNHHKVHLNEEGEPDMGNPNVIEAMTSSEEKGAVKGAGAAYKTAGGGVARKKNKVPGGRSEHGSAERDKQKSFAEQRAYDSATLTARPLYGGKGTEDFSREAFIERGRQNLGYDEIAETGCIQNCNAEKEWRGRALWEIRDENRRRIREYLDKTVPESSGWLERVCSEGDPRYINVKKLVGEGDDYAKFVVAWEALGPSEAVLALRDGTLDEVLTGRAAKNSVAAVARVESLYEDLKFEAERRVEEYKKCGPGGVLFKSDFDKAFGDGNYTLAKGYYDAVVEQHKDMSFDDFQLEQAYLWGGVGTDAETMNAKASDGEYSDLSEAEKDVIEMVSRVAAPLDEDVVLYRGSKDGPGTLSRRLGYFGKPEDIEGSADSIVGTEIDYGNLVSTAWGAMCNVWANECDVIYRYHVKAGTKVFVPENNQEGEVILPAGTKGVVTGVSYTNAWIPERVKLFGVDVCEITLGKMMRSRGPERYGVVVDIEIGGA